MASSCRNFFKARNFILKLRIHIPHLVGLAFATGGSRMIRHIHDVSHIFPALLLSDTSQASLKI